MRKLYLCVALFLVGSVILLPATSRAAAPVSWSHKSADLIATSTTDFGSATTRQSLAELAATGANYVTFIVQYYQTNTTSTDIQPGYNTPTDAALTAGIANAHALGLHVDLNFHLDPLTGAWRANINPTDRNTWFANYQQMLVHYATLAQQNGVETLNLGTEMNDVTLNSVHADNGSRWVQMIAAVRAVYKGLVTYDANWGEVNISFWPQLDFISISAYYTLNPNAPASLSQLEQDWQSWETKEIAPLANTYHKKVVFGEVGYRSIANAHYDSWNFQRPGPPDQAEQANDYTALFTYWSNRSYFDGVDLWFWQTSPTAGGVNDNGYTPQNKQAEQVMKQWFGSPVAPANFQAAANAPANISVGRQTSFTASATASTTYPNAIVDVEVYNSTGQRLQQNFFTNQTLTPTATNYTIPFTASAVGTDHIAVGIFSNGWQNNLLWKGSAATMTATGQMPANPVIDIWWPSASVSVSGLQPLKALVENAPLSSYGMYWQVDNGTLNPMSDSTAGGDHKEAWVNVDPWNWNSAHHYTVTFVAKDSNGITVAQKSAMVTAW